MNIINPNLSRLRTHYQKEGIIYNEDLEKLAQDASDSFIRFVEGLDTIRLGYGSPSLTAPLSHCLSEAQNAVTPRFGRRDYVIAINDPEYEVPASVSVILREIIRNADQFSPEGSEIRITSQPYKGGLRIDVEDFGDGLHTEDFKLLSIEGYTTRLKGTGTGLYLARLNAQKVSDLGTQLGIFPKNKEQENGAIFSIIYNAEVSQL